MTAEVTSFPPGSIDDTTTYVNRELSWLDFDRRVLAIAQDPTTPLLERVKFLAITHANLDEFFQVRVAGLRELAASGVRSSGPDDMTPVDALAAVRAAVHNLHEASAALFDDELRPALDDASISFSTWDSLDADDRGWLVEQFRERVFPVLTPLAVDPAHPFPYISNLSLNLAVTVRSPGSRRLRFARVKVPPILPRFVVMPDGERFVPLEMVIREHLDDLFPGMRIVEAHPFRVTRNADLDHASIGDEADDLLEEIESRLTQQRFGRVIRLEVEPDISDEVLGLLTRELEVAEDDVYAVPGPLGLAGLFAVAGLDRPDLQWESFTPTTQPRLRLGDDDDIFTVIREKDVLVQHPYDSFLTSVNELIRQASRDERVLAIKQTLYRTSADSPIVDSLIHAAEAGKQVVALVELKARFDEQTNIEFARALEEAGVHIIYGVVGLKTHTKTALVVRDDGDAIRRYAHVGTGNYNEKTARIYEDIGLLTADPDIGADLSDLFNFLSGWSEQREYRKLLVAPLQMRSRLLEMIEHEANQADGRIVMKMNSLVDAEMIDALYAASQRGTRVDLIVRGPCCLRPGVAGLSDNITVRSIVGRYLEHSRIYRFGTKARRRRYFIGSADLMPRNLDRRVEAITPVSDLDHVDRLEGILDLLREDDVLAWELDPDGIWRKVPTRKGIDSHLTLEAETVDRADPAPDVVESVSGVG